MSTGALHSDHVNYLILRYLQESGHENAATAFYRDWHRPRDHRDPETLPFAPAVGRYELISVIQEGLRHDELVSRVSQERRRFRWTLGTDALENGATGSRPSSSKRKNRTPQMRATEEFPIPAPKRQRRSEGPESVHMNGDREAMDVDAASPSADAEDDGDGASPTLGSDTEATEPPPRYDSVAIQTDVKIGPKTKTMYWKVDKPGALILHSVWNPGTEEPNSRTLLTVGDSLCRFYDIPASLQDSPEISHVDYPCLPTKFIVTATAWHPSGRRATCAVDSIATGENGDRIAEQAIIDHSRDHGSATYGSGLKVTHSEGIVLCLRYSPNGDHLLVGRTDSQRGSLQIWKTPKTDGDDYTLPRDPVAWRNFEHQILDACWIDDESFIVSGQQGLSASHRLVKEEPLGEAVRIEAPSPMQGMLEERPNLVAMSEQWDKVRYDSALNIAIFVSSAAKKLLPKSLNVPDSVDAKDTEEVIDLTGTLTAAALQPRIPTGDSDTSAEVASVLLALAFEEGYCNIYRISRTKTGLPACEEIAVLDMSEGRALALSWSPDGKHLAVGGVDLAEIWETATFAHEKTSVRRHASMVTWHADSEVAPLKNGQVNGNAHHEIMEPSLSWSSNGQSLAFAIDKQLAVIQFTPPLTAPETNGIDHGSAKIP